MQNGNSTIIGGTGFTGSIRTGNGNDTVTLQSGADQIKLGSGNNTVTTGTGYVGAITMFSNTPDVNSVTVGTGGVRSVGLSNGGFVEQLSLGSNIDKLVLKGTASVDQANLGSGNNVADIGSGHVGSLFAQEGNDIITIGMVEMLSMGQRQQPPDGGRGRLCQCGAGR